MAAELHYKDSGVWRKAKELYYKDGGIWRKLKEAWYKDGGVWRKVFSGAGPVSAFGGAVTASAFPAIAAVTVSLTIDSDGSFSSSATGSNVVHDDGTVGDKWFDPLTADAGNSYWVRATVTTGLAPSSGAGTDTWLALSAARTWTYSSGTGGSASSRFGTLLLEIASDAGGSVIVASGSYYMEAAREL